MVLSYCAAINNKTLGTPLKDVQKRFANGVNRKQFNAILNDSMANYGGFCTMKLSPEDTNKMFDELNVVKDNVVDEKEVKRYFAKYYNVSLDAMSKKGCTVGDLVKHMENVDRKALAQKRSDTIKKVFNDLKNAVGLDRKEAIDKVMKIKTGHDYDSTYLNGGQTWTGII